MKLRGVLVSSHGSQLRGFELYCRVDLREECHHYLASVTYLAVLMYRVKLGDVAFTPERCILYHNTYNSVERVGSMRMNLTCTGHPGMFAYRA